MTGSVLIRPLSKKDQDEIYLLEQEVFMANAWTMNNILSSLQNENDHYLGIYIGKELAGSLCCRLLYPEAELLTVGVKTAFRGQGLGKKLLEEMHRLLREKQIREVFLEVRENNPTAIGLYQEQGYKVIGKRRNYYRNPVDNALVMRKKFQASMPIGAEVLPHF